MTKTVILSCPTIIDEVRLCQNTGFGSSFDLVELSKNNHNFPDKLRSNLQDAIDSLQHYDRIILTFGICGNAAYGLHSAHAELVFPKVDDCISLLMGGVNQRMDSLNGKFGIFMTAGWLRFEGGMWGELHHSIERYGEKRAARIIARMYENLTYLTVLDTGAYDLAEILPRTEEMARNLHLEHRILQADLRLLQELLQGGEDRLRFSHIPPGRTVDAEQLHLDFRKKKENESWT